MSPNHSQPTNSHFHLLPAHQTKHQSVLHYPFREHSFHLTQLDNGITNGSALWLGAQCLTLYLQDLFKNKPNSHVSYPNIRQSARRPRAIELGSGIGLSACVLGAFRRDFQ